MSLGWFWSVAASKGYFWVTLCSFGWGSRVMDLFLVFKVTPNICEEKLLQKSYLLCNRFKWGVGAIILSMMKVSLELNFRVEYVSKMLFLSFNDSQYFKGENISIRLWCLYENRFIIWWNSNEEGDGFNSQQIREEALSISYAWLIWN